ncbi:SdrD B-like domain-containing protein [Pirellulaceae bacterium SH449]
MKRRKVKSQNDLRRELRSRGYRKGAAETLEARRLLAAEVFSEISFPFAEFQSAPALFSANPIHELQSFARSSGVMKPEGSAPQSGLLAEGEQGDAASIASPFVLGLRQTLHEIGRLLEATGRLPELTRPVPFLGELSAVSLGNNFALNSFSMDGLLQISERFRIDVSDPLTAFLDQFPQATPSQLISQFSFLQPVSNLAPGEQGVKIDFSAINNLSSSLTALLNSVVDSAASGFRPQIGNSLATELGFVLQTNQLSFDVVLSTLGEPVPAAMRIGLPSFSIDLSPNTSSPLSSLPVDFSASFGFLSGNVQQGSLSLESSLQIDLGQLGNLVDAGTQLPSNSISLIDLASLTSSSITDTLAPNLTGRGLELDLPFVFYVPGFDSIQQFPRFQLLDSNPWDSIYPTLEIFVPHGESYTLEQLLGFTTITPASVLQYLDQIGEVLDAWQSGSLLNVPIPLAGGLTLGDAVGLAESYQTAVLQFLRDAQTGLPRFQSLQELTTLIPAFQVYGPQQQSLRYDPETQQLFLSLNMLRQPDPIVAQANLDAFAGRENSPIATVQMTPGELGVDNRLTLSRSASLGLELAIDLAPNQRSARSALWTPISTILTRKGWGSVVNSGFANQGFASLRDGSQVSIALGTITAYDTVHDIVQRLRVIRNGVLVLDVLHENDQFVFVDRTNGLGTFQIRTEASGLSDAFFFALGIERFESTGFFNEYDGPSRIVSRPLSELFEPEELPIVSLPRLRHFPQGILAEPMRVHLRDGSNVLIEPGVVPGNLLLSELLERLHVVRDGVQVVRAEWAREQISLVDLTSGSNIFRTEWAEVSNGSPLLSRFLPLGRDVDGDGKLLGPSLVPFLDDDTQSPIRSETLLETILERRQLTSETSLRNASNVTLRDGTTVLMTTEPIDQESALGSLLEQLTIHRNGQIVVEAALFGDAIVLLDKTKGSGTFRVQSSLSDSTYSGNLFEKIGLVGLGQAGRIESRSLSTLVFDPQSPIGEILGPNHPGYSNELEQLELELSDNSRAVILNVGALDVNRTLTDLAESLSFPGNTIAYVEDGRIIVEDIFSPKNQRPMRFLEFRNPLLAQLFAPGVDWDRDGRLASNHLGPASESPLAQSRVTPDTLVREYLLTFLNSNAPISGVARMLADLRDGTQVSLEAQITSSTTMHELARQFTVERNGQVVLESQLVATQTANGSTEYRFVVVDRTNPNGQGNLFRIKMDPTGTPFFDSPIPMLLGMIGVDESGSGILLGHVLTSHLPEDRVRLMLTQPPVLYAEVSAIAANVQADARLGELASVGIVNGHGMATAAVQIEVVRPEGREWITLTEMLDSTARPREGLRVSVDANASFHADIVADFGTLLVPVDNPNQQPRIAFQWQDAITNTPNLRLNFDTLQPPTITNFSQLVKLKELTVRDITDLIRRLVDLVERVSGEELLGRRLPIVNTSLGEVLDTVDRVSDLVDRIVNDPQSTLKTLERDLEQVLGLADEELTLSFDSILGAIRMDVDLRLNPVQVRRALDVDLSRAGLSGLSSLVDFQAAAELTVAAGAELNLHIGLDLAALQSGSFDSAVLVYDSTGVQADILVQGDQMQFTTAIGPLGVGVGPGSVVLDRDGLAFGSTTNTDAPASFSVRLPDRANGIYRWNQLTPAQFTSSFEGVVGVDLPLTFQLGGATTQPLQIHWPQLNSTNFAQVATINPSGGNQIVLPDLNQAIGSFTLLDGVHALAAGLEGLFGLIERYLGDEVFGIPVPMIGQGLSDAVDFLERLRQELGSSIDVPGIGIAAARQAIFNALGPGSSIGGGNGVLGDLNGDGSITVEDVGLELNGDEEVLYRLKIAQTSIVASSGIALDVGVPGLGLVVDGNASVQMGYSLDIGFGLSASDGPFVQFFDGDELQLDFTASVADLVGEGRLGPFVVSVATIPPSRFTEEQRRASRLDPLDAASEKINAIGGRYAIDLGDGRYSLTNLGSIGSLGIQTQATLAGSLHLEIETSLGGNAMLPSISTGLHLTWESVSGGLDVVAASLVRPSIEFSNLSLDLGGFVSNVIAPMLAPVNDMLNPVRPILNALTTPIPILSDLAGRSLTMTDLMALTGSGGETVGEFVDAASVIVNMLNIPIVDGSVRLPLGNFIAAYNGDLLETTPAGGSFGGMGSFSSFLNSVEDVALRNYLQTMPRTEAGEAAQKSRFDVPILTNPSTAIGILLGQDVPLLTFDMPRLEAEFRYSQYIPIWPIFGVRFGGSVGITADFAFGYDTAGFRDYAQSRRASDLLNGFYISDTENVDGTGEDVPEVIFEGRLTAAGELNVLVAQAGVEGGLFARVLLNLNDPDGDGKVRGRELMDNLALGRHPLLGPLWVFDASGQLGVGFRAYVNTPIWDGDIDLGEIILLDFDIPRPDPFAGNPTLAHVDADGTLIVHVGPNAHRREQGDLSDGDDNVLIKLSADQTQIVVAAFGLEQPFSNVASIFVDAGRGNDRIEIASNVIVPATIRGGQGSDILIAGGGPATIFGGPGNDTIYGSSSDDLIYGEAGDDVIYGLDGNDTIYGGDGNDILYGGKGDDRLFGEAGNDTLYGNQGNDLLVGGFGSDILHGDLGDDELWGDNLDGTGNGDDVLYGGGGNDILRGGAGNDQLWGGLGSDQLYGGDGDDILIAGTGMQPGTLESPADSNSTHLLDGGTGNNLIYGDFGDDVVITRGNGTNRVWTFAGNDTITLGDGDDYIDAGRGDDVINAGGGNNTIYTGSGYDIVTAGNGRDFVDMRPDAIGPLSAGGMLGQAAAASRGSPIAGLAGYQTLAGGGASSSNRGGVVTIAGGNNIVHGDDGDLRIFTGAGNDWIDAGHGNNIVFSGDGNDTIRTGDGHDQIDAGNGSNDVSSGAGNDTIRTGSGNDVIDAGPGDDWISSGAGNDSIRGGSGNDWIDAGPGDDVLFGGEGDDVLIGGFGSDTIYGGSGRNVIWGGLELHSRDVLLGSGLLPPVGYSPDLAYAGFVPPLIRPAILNGQSLAGETDDGADRIFGGTGGDWIFGGGGNDTIHAGGGDNYVDGGAGDDSLFGGPGSDVMLGGSGNDVLRGGAGIDFLYGGLGNDRLYGDAGVTVSGVHHLFGQMLFGEEGDDQIFAFAPTMNSAVESALLGDRLDGGPGRDQLFGNLRREVLLGGPGDDLLEGDGLAGPNYAANPMPFTTGGGDWLYGDEGDDILLGGGGDDVLFGGAGSDLLEGHAGQDQLYGGTGIDFIRLDTDPAYAFGGDTIHGHFGNRVEGDVADDHATDILLINGTLGDDTILIGETVLGLLEVQYNQRTLTFPWRDRNGIATLEQFQINGLAGDDILGFVQGSGAVRLSDLALRSRDWVAVINGGSGNDILYGSPGRDRLNGGSGSDILYGYDGDDRLLGDDGDGSSLDLDVLYAGTGNDDLLGGVGRNHLFAWSRDPSQGTAFGVFVDPTTGETFDSPGAGRVLEDTGLNRMLGRDSDDLLFAGTGLDFLYGGGGNNTLHGPDGVPLEFGMGVPASEQWLEYARGTDKVWYYAGTDSNDVITVDYVTEPGLLGDHHLITRLTENNGHFTFDAQVRLDFEATDADGNRIWDPQDIVYRIEEVDDIDDPKARRLAFGQLLLDSRFLPPEGDFMAIIIDAKGGDDQVFVGPTVQRSVWINAGDGDDRVEIAGGSTILADLADAALRNDLAGQPSNPSRAFELIGDGIQGVVDRSTVWRDLTLDSPRDVDWYRFALSSGVHAESLLLVDSLSAGDQIELQLFSQNFDGTMQLLGTATPTSLAPSLAIHSSKPARWALGIGSLGLMPETTYWIRVRSLGGIPTLYDLAVDRVELSIGGASIIPLGTRSDVIRRDVIVGGAGHDVLIGGPGEDWIIGGPGNDVLSGGWDRGASDILIGEEGDDLFQILLDDLPVDASSNTLLLTLADEIDGGSGYNRIVFMGGDRDAFGRPIPDHVSMSYNRLLGSYEITGLVWDSANQSFVQAGEYYAMRSAQFSTRNVQSILFDLGAGDDELRLDSDYQFPKVDGTLDKRRSFGISAGDRQAGGGSLQFEIRGGDGNDRIFGSPYDDMIDGGAGIDFLVGMGGDDRVRGGADADILVGGDLDSSGVTPIDRWEATVRTGAYIRNDIALHAVPIPMGSGALSGLTLHDGDRADWYLLPLPKSGGAVSVNDFAVQFDSVDAQNLFDNPLWNFPRLSVVPARLDPTDGTSYIPTTGVPQAYLIQVRNPRSLSVVADKKMSHSELQGATELTLRVSIDGGVPRSLAITIDGSMTGSQVASALNTRIGAQSLSGALFAEYDASLERLVLSARNEQSLSVTGDFASGIRWIGFTSGQTNQEPPPGLGTYTLSTSRAFPDSPMGPQLATRIEVSPIARPDIDFVPPSPLMDISSGNQSVAAAMRIEGVVALDRLSNAAAIGDVNGDGLVDTILWGNQQAAIVLSEFEPQRSVVNINDMASFILPLVDGWRPIAGGADLDGDGRAETAFWRIADPQRIEVGLLPGSALAERVVSTDRLIRQVAVLPLTEALTSTVTADDVDIEWMQWDADGIADMLIVARQPRVQRGTNPGYGGVLSGTWMRDVLDGSNPPAGAFQMSVWINGTTQTHSIVQGSLPTPSEWQRSTGAAEAGFDQQIHARVGDIDGDGMDEIVLVQPQGWRFTNSRTGESIAVARVYTIDTQGNPAANVTLGAGVSRPRVQTTATIELNQAGNVRQAALNQDQPLLVADFDFDGRADLVLARDFDLKTGESDSLLVFRGQQLTDSKPLTELDASATFGGMFRETDSWMIGLSMVAGDFDGDRQLDLAIGAIGDSNLQGSLNVLYNPLTAEGVYDIRTESWGDSRVDWVRVTGLQPGDGLGRLRGRAHDLNGDGMADILVGVPGFDSSFSGDNAGAIFIVPGIGRRVQLPPPGSILELANESLRGRGDVLVDLGSPLEFSGGSNFLSSPRSENWFRFTTVGDGSPGDILRLSPYAIDEPSVLLEGISGDIESGTSNTRQGRSQFESGGELQRTAVMEFDLSPLLEAYDRPNQIMGASLTLSASSSSQTDMPALRNPYGLTSVAAGTSTNPRVFFSTRESEESLNDQGEYVYTEKTYLWLTDGTSEGTRVVANEYGVTGVGIGHRALVQRFVCTSGDCYIEPDFGWVGGHYELAIHDGQSAIKIGDFGSLDTFIEREGIVYFIGSTTEENSKRTLNRVVVDSSGVPHWNVAAESTEESMPHFYSIYPVASDSGVFFSYAKDGVYRLWHSKGTLGSQEHLLDFDTTLDFSQPTYRAVAFDGGIVFAARRGTISEALWYSDGKRAGTRLVKDVNPNDNPRIHAFGAMNDRVYFIADSNDLWVTDGTTSGTKKVRTIFSAPVTSSRVSQAVVVDNHYVVSKVNHNVSTIGNITLFSVDKNGNIVHQAQWNGVGTPGLYSLVESRGEVLASLILRPAGGTFADSQSHLVRFAPTTGDSKELLVIPGFNPVYEFGGITGGPTVFTGPSTDVNDDEYGLLWHTDHTPDGTYPITVLEGGSGEAGGLQNVEMTIEVRPAKRDGMIDKFDLEGEVFLSRTISVTTDSQGRFTVPLTTNIGLLNDFRRLFDLGYRSVSVSIRSGSSHIFYDAPNPGLGTGLRVERSRGVGGTLLDGEGRLIADSFSVLDLRNRPAGTYYLKVSQPEHSETPTFVPFSIFIDPPSLGASHPLTDNDLLRGGDGDDYLVGGAGRDRMFGESGRDIFVGDSFEPVDRSFTGTIGGNGLDAILEPLRDGASEHRTFDRIDSRITLDPIAVLRISSNDAPVAGLHQFEINSLELARRIAGELGIEVISFGDVHRFSREVRASELATIIRLDASNAGITNLAGLERLIGLESLDLSGNELTAIALSRLIPQNNGELGAAKLRSLNLDGNRIGAVGGLSGLNELRVLSLASQRVPLSNITPLGQLASLVYLDLSGNEVSNPAPLAGLSALQVLDLSNNALASLASLTRVYVRDESVAVVSDPEQIQHNQTTTASAYGGFYYMIQPRSENMGATTGSVRWTVSGLPAGEYDVLATWFGDGTHSTEAQFTLGGQSVLVNQQLAPSGAPIDGRPFQYIGNLSRTSIGNESVFLTTGNDSRIAIADAILVRSRHDRLPSLQRIALEGNPLDDATHRIIVPTLEDRAIQVDYDRNLGPIWHTTLGPRVADGDGVVLISNLSQYVNDPDGVGLQWSGVANHSGVEFDWNGDWLKLTATGPIDRPVIVWLTATDVKGRSSSAPLSIAFMGSLVTGRLFEDENTNGNLDAGEQPLSGQVVYLDMDGDGQYSLDDPFALTDKEGQYAIWTSKTGSIPLRVIASQSVSRVSPDFRTVQISEAGNVLAGNDFGLQTGIRIDGVAFVNEGDIVTLDAIAHESLSGTGTWSISGGPLLDVSDLTGPTVKFRPMQDGIYTVQYSYNTGANTLVASYQLAVLPVTPSLNVGSALAGSQAVPKGRFQLSRPMIVDPGADTWHVTIDYGDGSPAVSLPPQINRTISLDHVYRFPGVYNVSITVANEEGSVTEVLPIEVLNQAPIVQLHLKKFSDQVDAYEGQEALVLVTIDDPTFTANVADWSYTIQWGDGTVETFAGWLETLDGADVRHQAATLSHAYAVEGNYDIVVTTVDSSGAIASATKTIQVVNAPPVLEWITFYEEVLEDIAEVWSVRVFDIDPVTVVWDFDEGRGIVEGTTASWSFSEPGLKTVRVRAVDSEGALSEIVYQVLVVNTPDPPVWIPFGIQSLFEEVAWSLSVTAVDSDPGDVISYSLESAPDGMTIDTESGLIQWTPGLDQSGQVQSVTVKAQDQYGLAANQELILHVFRHGAVSGVVFEDSNRNGRIELGESPQSGFQISLVNDMGTVFHRNATTNEQGEYQFDRVPTGTYRLVVHVPNYWEATTPIEGTVEITSGQHVRLLPIGMTNDSDGDGVSNQIEQSFGVLDANGDGIPDWLQPNIVTVGLENGNRITLIAPIGTALSDVVVSPIPPGAPGILLGEQGMLSYRLSGIPIGGSAVVELRLMDSRGVTLPTVSAVYKYDPSIVAPNIPWYALPDTPTSESAHVEILTDRVMITLFDGKPGDADGIANGVIVDPIAFVIDDLANYHRGWTNPANALDVDGDGTVSPLDVLTLINQLNAGGLHLNRDRFPDEGFYDVDSDGTLSPLDVLRVINYLNGGPP